MLKSGEGEEEKTFGTRLVTQTVSASSSIKVPARNSKGCVEINAILFDKDGTLLDFLSAWMPIIFSSVDHLSGDDKNLREELLKVGGFDVSKNAFIPDAVLSAGSASDAAKLWLPLLKGKYNENDIEAYLDETSKAAAMQMEPTKGLLPFLVALRKKDFALGIATHDSEENALQWLRTHNMTHYFDFVCGYDSKDAHGRAYSHKPSGDMLHAFCKKTARLPAQVAVVGDNTYDVQMGKNGNAGWVVGVLTGTSSEETLKPHCDAVFSSVVDMISYL